MKTLLFLAILITGTLAFGQEVERPLNGPVKEVLEKTYAPGPEPKFSRQSQSFYGKDGSMTAKFVFNKGLEGDYSAEIENQEEHVNVDVFTSVYRNDVDSAGHLIRRFRNERVEANDRLYLHFYDENGNDTLIEAWDLFGKLLETMKYEYDNKGNVTAWKGFFNDREITSTVGKASFKYYQDGSVKEKMLDSVTWQKAFPFTTFKYNEKGELLEEYHLDDNQKKVYHQKTEFKEGKKVRFIKYKKGEKDIVYMYNAAGQETSMTKYKAGATEPVFTRTYEYNEQGNVVKMEMIQTRGNIKVEWGFEYKYDKHDNWIERLETEDGREFRLTKREIKYYEG